MPPYTRLIEASAAAWLNDWKFLFMPMYWRSLVSRKEKLSPNIRVRTVAAEAEIPLCPLGCSGNGGVCNNGCQLGSIDSLMTVMGRMCWYSYLVFQQQIIASNIAEETSA